MIEPEDDAKQMYMLAQRSARFSFNKLVSAFLKNSKNSAFSSQGQSGKVKLKELVKQGHGVTSIEFKDSDTKLFERYAKKYGITFSVVKEQSADDKLPTFKVFFKAKDEDVIKMAFEKYSKDVIARATKLEDKEEIDLEKLAEIKQEIRENMPEKSKIKKRKQVQTL